MKKTIFYHGGRPVRMVANDRFARFMATNRYQVEVVHVGPVPAMIADSQVFHHNYGTDISASKSCFSEGIRHG